MGPLYVQEEFLGEESLGAKYMGEKPQKYPALSTQQNTQLGVFLSTSLGFWDMGQHGTTIKWFFFHPTLKYPAAPKIPSSVDTTKYPAWSLFVDIPWLLGHRTAWDHYKRKTISIPPKEIPSCPKMPSSVDTSLFVDIPWLLGHGTAWDQWKTTRK